MGYPGDCAWLPSADADFRKYMTDVCSRWGWPRGPVNAVELWNEPWEGISISGWGADMPRYREMYTAMAEGVVDARKSSGIQVLIGGTCSSMNTEDKLFPDGKDTFLKWLDFTSIHYQPMGTEPTLNPMYINRKSPFGAVRAWDTESWIANSEDRVAGVIAGMRATGLTRTNGVDHEFARVFEDVNPHVAGSARITIVQPLPTSGGIAAVQAYIGDRPFKQLVFQHGLPWVMQFDGIGSPDDGTLVVVGDLGSFFDPDSLLYRQVRGESTVKAAANLALLKAQLTALPASATADQRALLAKAMADVASSCTMRR